MVLVLFFQVVSLYYLMTLLALEVKCKVNPQMVYTRFFFFAFAAVYLAASVIGILRNYDSEVKIPLIQDVLFSLYLLLFGRFILCLSLAIYNEYHIVNFHSLVPQDEAVQMPTEQPNGKLL